VIAIILIHLIFRIILNKQIKIISILNSLINVTFSIKLGHYNRVLKMTDIKLK